MKELPISDVSVKLAEHGVVESELELRGANDDGAILSPSNCRESSLSISRRLLIVALKML